MRDLLLPGWRGAVAIALGAMLVLSLVAPAVAADSVRPLVGQTTEVSAIGSPTTSCPIGSMFAVDGTGTGNIAHLGRVNFTLHHCAIVDFETGLGSTTGPGSVTIIAANGDRLVLSYTMTFVAKPVPVPTTADAHMSWVVAGGTGRFAAASGSGEAWMTVRYTPDLTGATGSTVWSGTVNY